MLLLDGMITKRDTENATLVSTERCFALSITMCAILVFDTRCCACFNASRDHCTVYFPSDTASRRDFLTAQRLLVVKCCIVSKLRRWC